MLEIAGIEDIPAEGNHCNSSEKSAISHRKVRAKPLLKRALAVHPEHGPNQHAEYHNGCRRPLCANLPSRPLGHMAHQLHFFWYDIERLGDYGND